MSTRSMIVSFTKVLVFNQVVSSDLKKNLLVDINPYWELF